MVVYYPVTNYRQSHQTFCSYSTLFSPRLRPFCRTTHAVYRVVSAFPLFLALPPRTTFLYCSYCAALSLSSSYLSIYLSLSLSNHIYLSIYLSLSNHIYLSIYLSRSPTPCHARWLVRSRTFSLAAKPAARSLRFVLSTQLLCVARPSSVYVPPPPPPPRWPH